MSITTIRTALEVAIRAMTIAGGYNHNWTTGTLNPAGSDINSVLSTAFPVACIWTDGEQCLNPDDNNAIITNEITFEIDAIPKKDGTTAEDVDKVVRDIKRLVGRNPSLGINGVFIRYTNEKRFMEAHRVDYGSTITVKVKYLEYRINP